ncbi:MAG TPA: hypothetical protein VGE79_06195 [Niastella sp.]
MWFNRLFAHDYINSDELAQLLDEIVSPRLDGKGLTRRDKLVWYNDSSNAIRQGLRYALIKGGRGTFYWGVCLDFIPMQSGSGIKYCRTAQLFELQLFEWPEEISNSFFEGKIDKGVADHRGYQPAKRAITKLFNRLEEEIFQWWSTAHSIESLIEIAEAQIKTGRQYDMHHPNPAYILAFLYARNGQYDKAVYYFDRLSNAYFDSNDSVRSKLRDKLLQTK